MADVGCDHAYISIYLAEKGLSPHIIAMDINKGPLERAKENIRKYGYEGVIETRRSDGIKLLQPGEADTILIAGMGGALMRQILVSRPEILKETKELILQPQSEIYLVRKTLCDFGYFITAENMLIEDGKHYVCMKAEAGRLLADTGPFKLTRKEHFYYGRLLLEQRDPVLREYLLKEKLQLEKIYGSLSEHSTEHALLRRKEIMEELELIGSCLRYYEE